MGAEAFWSLCFAPALNGDEGKQYALTLSFELPEKATKSKKKAHSCSFHERTASGGRRFKACESSAFTSKDAKTKDIKTRRSDWIEALAFDFNAAPQVLRAVNNPESGPRTASRGLVPGARKSKCFFARLQ